MQIYFYLLNDLELSAMEHLKKDQTLWIKFDFRIFVTTNPPSLSL